MAWYEKSGGWESNLTVEKLTFVSWSNFEHTVVELTRDTAAHLGNPALFDLPSVVIFKNSGLTQRSYTIDQCAVP